MPSYYLFIANNTIWTLDRTNVRVPNALASARAAERDMVQHRHVVAHNRGLPNHDSSGVIDKHAAPDARGRVDVRVQHLRHAALQRNRQRLRALSALSTSIKVWTGCHRAAPPNCGSARKRQHLPVPTRGLMYWYMPSRWVTIFCRVVRSA